MRAGEEVGRDHPVALVGEALAEADELGGHAVALVDDDHSGAGGGGVGGGDGEGGEREFGHGRTLPRRPPVAPVHADILDGYSMGQDDQPRTLKAMLSEAKDTSELMVDLAYAALFFGDAGMADEVHELEERLSDLAHTMREVCVLAARSPRDAEEMSSVLHVLSAIERMGNAAVDIARIVTHRLGIPAALVADLAAAEEISHRVRVRPEALLAHRSLADASLPTEVGMRVVAIRRGKDWMIDPDGDDTLLPDDVLILRGPAAGIPELRVLAGAPEWRPPGTDIDPAIPTDLDRAVDVLVEMKNVSEVAIGLAYSALLFNDQGLAAEVSHLEDRLDEMRERLEVWVLRSASEQVEPSPLRGLLHLGAAAEELGDAAQQMVWLVEENEEMHPVLAIALRRHRRGDRCACRCRRDRSSTAARIAETNLELETGYYLLAIRRAGRYLYRPRGSVVLEAGDELIASGPDEGRSRLAEPRRVPRARGRRHRRDRPRARRHVAGGPSWRRSIAPMPAPSMRAPATRA